MKTDLLNKDELSDLDDLKPPKKPARNKLSSASFNRVLRKIDHTSNETMFLERPGKRLKNRPRSMSSLNSHNRVRPSVALLLLAGLI